MTSDFLGPVQRSLYLLWFLYPGFPESFQWVSCFLEASWTRAPLYFDSDLVLDPSLQTQTEATICVHTIKSETLQSLLRIGCTDHQIQFTSILGRSAQSVSECVSEAALLIPEPLQAITLPVPGQSCHFFDQRLRNTASGRCHPGPKSLQIDSQCSLKGDIAAASRILGESETHTSQHEPLLVTSPKIQTQCNSLLYFPVLVTIKGFSH